MFGSRVKGTHRNLSDLDLCIKSTFAPLEKEALKEDFDLSDLPFEVDILEWPKIDKTFQKTIEKDLEKF